MNSFENDKVKVTYPGEVIEGIQTFMDAYKNAMQRNGGLLSVGYLEFLVNQTLSSSEFGRGYLKQSE